MISRAALALLLLISPSAAGVRDLTPEHVRGLLAAVGVNPGTSRMLDGERYVLRSVVVANGGRPGEFLIRLRVEVAD
jgi:hypothetical protein